MSTDRYYHPPIIKYPDATGQHTVHRTIIVWDNGYETPVDTGPKIFTDPKKPKDKNPHKAHLTRGAQWKQQLGKRR